MKNIQPGDIVNVIHEGEATVLAINPDEIVVRIHRDGVTVSAAHAQVQAQTEPQPTQSVAPAKRFITTWEQIPTEEPTHRLDDNNTETPCK